MYKCSYTYIDYIGIERVTYMYTQFNTTYFLNLGIETQTRCSDFTRVNFR